MVVIMINEILEDNLLLVIPNQIKEEVIKEVSKNNGIYDIKFMSLDQLIKKLRIIVKVYNSYI